MFTIFRNSITRNFVAVRLSRSFSVGMSMKSVNKYVVESLERLALVDFPTETCVARLGKCIEYADQLMEVNTEGVEPLISTVYEMNDNIRNDNASELCNREELMKIAPVTEEFYYVAPLETFSRKQDKSS